MSPRASCAAGHSRPGYPTGGLRLPRLLRGARKPRDLAAAEEELDPQLAGFLSQDAEEKEDEETLEGCENGKEILESERGIRYRECTKYPRQPEKEHDSENTD